MATSVSHIPRKSNMMERLRRLRVPSTVQPTATAPPEKVIVTTQRSAVIAKDDREPRPSKSQPLHSEGALDLEVLDNKLKQYAQTRNQGDDDDLRATEDGFRNEAGCVPGDDLKGSQGSGVDAQTKKKAAEGAADSAFDQDLLGASSRQSSQNSASTCPSIVVHPPDDEPPVVPGSSDYELFLQQAEDDERSRKEKGLPALAKSKQEPSVNPFYSNNLASPTTVPPKLEEIQETVDEESLVQTDDSSSQHTSSTASSGSNDFAATDTQPSRANTASFGRHVSFCEPAKLRARSDSHGSAYHARGFESPKAPRSITERKSFRKMVKNCMRHF